MQRPTLEEPLGGGADTAHQAQGFAIGADEQMLSVIEPPTVDFESARPSAGLAGRFEDGDRDAGRDELDGAEDV